jgi:hypothetical protein
MCAIISRVAKDMESEQYTILKPGMFHRPGLFFDPTPLKASALSL